MCLPCLFLSKQDLIQSYKSNVFIHWKLISNYGSFMKYRLRKLPALVLGLVVNGQMISIFMLLHFPLSQFPLLIVQCFNWSQAKFLPESSNSIWPGHIFNYTSNNHEIFKIIKTYWYFHLKTKNNSRTSYLVICI